MTEAQKTGTERLGQKGWDWNTVVERLGLKDLDWKTETERLKLKDWDWKTKTERLRLKDSPSPQFTFLERKQTHKPNQTL